MKGGRFPKESFSPHREQRVPGFDGNDSSGIFTQGKANKIVLDFAIQVKDEIQDENRFFTILKEQNELYSDKTGAVYTLLYRAIFEVARLHPELTHELSAVENAIGQNAQMIKIKDLMDIALDSLSDLRVNEVLKSDIMHTLTYVTSGDRDEEFIQFIRHNLDFENKDLFLKTARLLEFTTDFYNMADGAASSTSMVSQIREGIMRAIDKKQGSYLLNTRAQKTLESMDGRSHIWSEYDRTPFFLTKDVLAYSHEDGLYIATPESSQLLTKNILSFKDVEKRLLQSGQQIWHSDDSDIKERERLFQSFTELTPKKIDCKDILLTSDSDTNEEILFDYAYLVSKPMREIIKNDFDIELSELSIPEQFQLLNVLREQSLETADTIKVFSKHFGINGLRTFLVTADDDELRKKVFDFSSLVSKEDAQKVFAAYGNLVGSIDTVADYLRESFGSKNSTAVNAIVEQLLSRARALLAQAHDYRYTPDRLIELTKSRQLENALFLDSFRALKQIGEVPSLEEIRDVRLSKVELRDQNLSETDKTTMINIAQKNYQSYPAGLRDEVLQSLNDAMKNVGTQFHILRYKDEIIGFVRFDDRPNDTDGRVHKYAGSLNIDFDFRSSKLGETMMEQTILKEAETAILDAVCDADKNLTEKYIELGFVGARYWIDNEVPTLNIVFDQGNNMRLKTRGLSQEQIMRSANNGAVSPSYRLLTTTERPDFSKELRDGEILTRYFSHTDSVSKQMKYYIAFERILS